MNTLTKLSAAVTLGLGLMGASLAAHAASAHALEHARQTQTGVPNYGRVMQLGTIQVTPADAEGAAAPVRHYGATVYLGKVNVTPDASPEARSAALAAAQQGAVFLGSVTVTAADAPDARYAANQANASGAVFLGSVQVTPRDAHAPALSRIAAAVRALGPKVLFAMIGALAFARAGG